MTETTLKNYELSFLLEKEEDSETVWKHLAAVKAEIESKSPVVSTILSYPIKKHAQAYFGYARFNLDGSQINLLNEAMRLDTKVLRHLIIASPPAKMQRQERQESSGRQFRARKPVAKETSNEALEAKLASLTGGVIANNANKDK
ncbi:MAG: 30S ribosomal protein S6 [Candidatus Colwellbacteria bacterium RIFCSPLOWO2_01_FULL_48_10]|uniref:Small ribosomal subunit protein bS6 n=1 Tax=Candidatus Colwellbacteria bacterium RIFCSPLOWO2_01_FULL_48_10 TaxID=1797690 RepID=A0A1G1Z3N2_9BACT|nr:MAG: 30S ribosomal protein S6 [Candidatus Colwellbacteria bacterium RIFCSPLOWO2_01_FULL_48_10]